MNSDLYLDVAAARIETRDFLLPDDLFAGVNGLIVIPGSTFGLWDRLAPEILGPDDRIDGEWIFDRYRGDSECREIDRGVLGESKSVNLRRRLAATGLLVGDDSESGINPGLWLAVWSWRLRRSCGEGTTKRRRRRASFKGEHAISWGDLSDEPDFGFDSSPHDPEPERPKNILRKAFNWAGGLWKIA